MNIMLLLFLVLAASIEGGPSKTPQMTVKDLLAQSPVPADFTIPYGGGPQQFGQLRLPKAKEPFPVVVVIHGGCWLAEYDLEHIGPLAGCITELGFATWSLEYRRVGNPGGGWPGTFSDIADGIDHLKQLAGQHHLDLKRVITLGHSAGGHLALWAAGRHKLPAESPLYRDHPLQLQGVVSLAGIGDLSRLDLQPGCGKAVLGLMGGVPGQVPERYRQGSPRELLPMATPQILIQGTLDPIVTPAGARAYHSYAIQLGDPCTLVMLPEAGHYDVVIPSSSAWSAVKEVLNTLLRRQPL